MASTRQSEPLVVLFPSHGIGHLLPIIELAKRLFLHHDLAVTLITTTPISDDPRLSSLPDGISTVHLPPPPLSDLPAATHIVTRISVANSRSASAIGDILCNLRRTARVAAFVTDFFGGDCLAVAGELGVPRFIFFTSNLFCLSFLMNFPAIFESTESEFRELRQPLRLPGCLPLKGEDFVDPVQVRGSEACSLIIRQGRQYEEVDGILVNTFDAMESAAAEFFRRREEQGKPPVWPIGPLICSKSDPKAPRSTECEWLDQQPAGSVLFVCLGSGGTLSPEQTTEIALGLEMSGQRFLWVVREPNTTDASGAYFHPEAAGGDPLGFLPVGFPERTKERALLVPSWAPQVEVLGHSATGGFLSHCGWNSTLESVVHGVPMIAWPLYSEQRMNAVLLVEGAKVALRPPAAEYGVVAREAVAEVVKRLMDGEEGKEVRQRMRQLQAAAATAAGKEGTSGKAMEKVVGVFKCSVEGK